MSYAVVAIIILDLMVMDLLLIGALKLCGGRCDRLRIFAAALLSAIHSGAVFLGVISGMDTYVSRLAVLSVTGCIAFGWKRGSICKTAVFLLLNTVLEAALNSRYLVVLLPRLAVAASIFLLCYILRGKGKDEKAYSHIEIRYDEKKVRLEALRDTGNHLKDPMTGAPVLVIGPEKAYHLTGLTRKELAEPLETLKRRPVKGLRLIPFSSVGNSHGLMLGIRSRETVVDGLPTDMVIAMAPEGMGKYEALIGGYHGTWDHHGQDQKADLRSIHAPLHRWLGCTAFAAEGNGGAGGAGSPGTGG